MVVRFSWHELFDETLLELIEGGPHSRSQAFSPKLFEVPGAKINHTKIESLKKTKKNQN